MNIRKASPADLIEVLYLLHVCIQEMNSKGWIHWDLENLTVKDDIEDGIVFIYKENETCLGMVTLTTEEAPEYKDVLWNQMPGRPLLVKRLIVHSKWHTQGIEKQLITFAEQFGIENGFSSLRLDVFAENKEAVALYEQLNFKYSGEIMFQYQKVPNTCFEKVLNAEPMKVSQK